MRPLKILCFAGSNRSGSFNHALAGAMVKQLGLMNIEVSYISLADYPLPLFDQDDEKAKGLPENAVGLAKLFAAHDGIFIASPEYNASVTPLLKNTLDWISRVPVKDDQPFRHKPFVIGAASPGNLGGMRALPHLRQVLNALGALVLSEQIAISGASTAFDEKGDLKDEQLANILSSTAQRMVEICKRLNP